MSRLVTVCRRCHPPTGIEQPSLGIIQGRCEVCDIEGASPVLATFRLRDILQRLATLEARAVLVASTTPI